MDVHERLSYEWKLANSAKLASKEIRMATPHITDSETQRAPEDLNSNKGAGPDGLFPKALKTLSPYIAPELSHIFNLSLQTSQIPDDWLYAIVTPVAKAPRTADPTARVAHT